MHPAYASYLKVVNNQNLTQIEKKNKGQTAIQISRIITAISKCLSKRRKFICRKNQGSVNQIKVAKKTENLSFSFLSIPKS
jgi:hypothetical protein